MKTVGVILVVTGLIIVIFGYGQYGNIVCHCPAQMQGKPFTCACGQDGDILGHELIYAGIAITTTGIVIFVIQAFKKSTLKNV